MVDPVSVGSVSLTGDLRRRQTGRKMFVAHIKHYKLQISWDPPPKHFQSPKSHILDDNGM